MATILGPRILDEPLVVYKGDSFKPRVRVKDGVRVAAKPLGADVNVSAASVKGVLTVNKPDDATDVTRDTSVAGEGTKTDVDSVGFVHAFDFYAAGSVTATWLLGIHDFEVRYEDSAPTPADIKLVLIGQVHVRAKPGAL